MSTSDSNGTHGDARMPRWDPQIVPALPVIADGKLYVKWRYLRQNSYETNFERLVSSGDALMRTVGRAHLRGVSENGEWIDMMATCFENRYGQLLMTLSVGLDDEVDAYPPELHPGFSSEAARWYSDILVAYLAAVPRERALPWLNQMAVNFFSDLFGRVWLQRDIWGIPHHDFDFFAVQVHLTLGEFGPRLVLSLAGHDECGYDLWPDCHEATTDGHVPRWVPHDDMT